MKRTCDRIVVILAGIVTSAAGLLSPCVADAGKWQEPAWEKTGGQAVRLRFRFTRGERIRYRQMQQSKITAAGQTTELDVSCTKVWTVEGVSQDGTAQVASVLEGLTLEVAGKSRPWSGGVRGRFSIRPTGGMERITGTVDQRSLPTFPPGPVRLGSKWTAPMGFAGGLDDPTAVAEGKATYTLAGLADVGGHTWAKILFRGELALPKRWLSKKVIGVKCARRGPPAKAGSTRRAEDTGAAVAEAVKGYPAEKAGLRTGDRIVELAGVAVEDVPDLLYAVAVAPAGKASPIVMVRHGIRRKLLIMPRTVASFQAEARGTFKGRLVFDVTAGRLVRGEMKPLTATVTMWPDGGNDARKIQQQFVASALTQLQTRAVPAIATSQSSTVPATRAAPGDEQAVRKLAEDYVRAYATLGQAPTAKLQQILAEDFMSAFSNGTAAEGRGAFLRVYRKAMAEIRQLFRSWAVRLEIRSVRVFGQAAVVFGTVIMEGRPKDGNGEKPFRKEVWETLVFRKAAGRWRLIHEHATPRRPAKPREPAAAPAPPTQP
jgi:uncharacterized protein (TIGR02246 family)